MCSYVHNTSATIARVLIGFATRCVTHALVAIPPSVISTSHESNNVDIHYVLPFRLLTLQRYYEKKRKKEKKELKIQTMILSINLLVLWTTIMWCAWLASLHRQCTPKYSIPFYLVYELGCGMKATSIIISLLEHACVEENNVSQNLPKNNVTSNNNYCM